MKTTKPFQSNLAAIPFRIANTILPAVLLGLLIVFVCGLPVQAQCPCPQIGGTYPAEIRITTTVVMFGYPYVDTAYETGTAQFNQTGCDVELITTDDKGTYRDTGTISGNHINFGTGPVPPSNLGADFVITEATLSSATGTIGIGRIDLQQTGQLRGTYRGVPFNAYVTVDAYAIGNVGPVGAPTVIFQPLNQDVIPDAPADFSVTAIGGCLNYQWRKNNVNIPGATKSSYTINQAKATDAASYDVAIWNSYGSTASSAVSLEVCFRTAPTITVQPQSQKIANGTALNLSVTATGNCLSYQWRRNLENINNATNSTLSVSSAVDLFHAGTYDVVIWNPYGDLAVSKSAAVEICDLTFYYYPQMYNQILTPGQSTSFRVDAFGGCVEFQWRKNHQNIPGARGPSYTIPSAQTGDAGEYDVVMWNAFGDLKASPSVSVVVCTQTISPSVVQLGASGGNSDLVNVTSPGDCFWGVHNTNEWISANWGAYGNGSFAVYASPNEGDLPRVGYLTIGNSVLAVAQAGRRAPTHIGGKTFHMTMSGGTDRFLVKAKENGSYRATTISGIAPSGTGTFVYTRSDDSSSLTLEGNVTATFTLIFDTPTSGTFTIATTEGEMPGGTFTVGESGPDFPGNDLPDILIQRTNGAIAGWSMNGTNFLGSFLFNPNKPREGWRFSGQGDFNGDTRTDLLFQHNDTRKVAVFLMDGTNQIAGRMLRNGTPTAAGWRTVGAADFNNDSKCDVLLQHDSGKVALWLMDGTNFVTGKTLRHGASPGAAWKIVGTGDFDGDQQTDILLQHTDGRTAVWYFYGTDYVTTRLLRNSGAEHTLGWRIRGASDLNNDGYTDVLLENILDRRVVGWFFNQTTFQESVLLRHITPGWHVVGPR